MSFRGFTAHFFLAPSNIPLFGCATVYLFSTYGHVGSLHILAIMNKTAFNIHLYVFVWAESSMNGVFKIISFDNVINRH